MCATNPRLKSGADVHEKAKLLNVVSTEPKMELPAIELEGTSEFEIRAQTLKVTQEIGRGQFGRVCAGTWQGTPVAMKVLHDTAAPKNRELFVREVETMARLHHPHIVQFFGFAQFIDGGASQLCIVMELFARQSVEDYVGHHSKTSAPNISAATKRRFCSEMSMALAYLHNRRPAFVIHRDIKPCNFMLTDSLRVKLCDFGLSRLFSRADRSPKRRSADSSGAVSDDDFDQTANCGTVRFMAPEVAAEHESATYSAAADVFSLGMVFSFVHERELPRIAGCTRPRDYLAALRDGRRPPHGAPTPKPVRALIDAAWATDARARPSASELVDWWQDLHDASGRTSCGARLFSSVPRRPD